MKQSFKGNWKIERIRDDKDHANMLWTAIKIWKSITDNITQEELLKELMPKMAGGQRISEKVKWKKTKVVTWLGFD